MKEHLCLRDMLTDGMILFFKGPTSKDEIYLKPNPYKFSFVFIRRQANENAKQNVIPRYYLTTNGPRLVFLAKKKIKEQTPVIFPYNLMAEDNIVENRSLYDNTTGEIHSECYDRFMQGESRALCE